MIPTAEEQYTKSEDKSDLIEAMIEFAKLHVQEALKQASENADMNDDYYNSQQEGSFGGIDKDSILEAYPLDNIK